MFVTIPGAAERYAKEGDDNKTGYFKRMMVDKINKRQHEKNGIFECIRYLIILSLLALNTNANPTYLSPFKYRNISVNVPSPMAQTWY